MQGLLGQQLLLSRPREQMPQARTTTTNGQPLQNGKETLRPFGGSEVLPQNRDMSSLRLHSAFVYTCIASAASYPLRCSILLKPNNTTRPFSPGGCFLGVDVVFKHVKGVQQVVSGYRRGRPRWTGP